MLDIQQLLSAPLHLTSNWFGQNGLLPGFLAVFIYPFFHHLPKWRLKGGVLFNHFIELIVPIGYFSDNTHIKWQFVLA